jgi:hypothetical protein
MDHDDDYDDDDVGPRTKLKQKNSMRPYISLLFS